MRDLSSFITQRRGGGEGKEGGISRPKNTKIMIVLTISLIHPVSNRIGA